MVWREDKTHFAVLLYSLSSLLANRKAVKCTSKGGKVLLFCLSPRKYFPAHQVGLSHWVRAHQVTVDFTILGLFCQSYSRGSQDTENEQIPVFMANTIWWSSCPFPDLKASITLSVSALSVLSLHIQHLQALQVLLRAVVQIISVPPSACLHTMHLLDWHARAKHRSFSWTLLRRHRFIHLHYLTPDTSPSVCSFSQNGLICRSTATVRTHTKKAK